MAGSMGELKPLVLVITVLATFAILMSMIPSEFYAESYEGRELNVPEYFESSDIYSFATTYNFTIPSTYWDKRFDLGGWHVMFKHYVYGEDKHFFSKTYDTWWVFEWGWKTLNWYNNKGIDVSEQREWGPILTYDALDDNYDEDRNECKFTLKNNDVTFIVYFGFNTTTYSMPSEALAAGELECLYCLNFDQINTSFNAWNLVGAILFFQMPDVHPIINAIIAIPLWVCIGYLTFVLILKAIPFVGG